jgi:cytidylate kinase|tara:strand:- start:1252 stop:1872 length:621 start_codon:yes stop_codon:yes gene_type:complete
LTSFGLIIAIDGTAASGKGTISRKIAQNYCVPHLDTGLLYRLVGYHVLQGIDPIDAANQLNVKQAEVFDLKTLQVSNAASEVAKNPTVRAKLLEFQRRFASKPGGAVLDGRDIGTVICPNADLKFYITASSEVRAQRRHSELLVLGHKISYESVLREIQERDERDTNREQSPLLPAEDANKIDTSDMNIGEVYDLVCLIIDAKLEK